MNKNELQCGDIIINRMGERGVLAGDPETGMIYFQENGMDDIEQFNDDLTDSEDERFDIMEVHRGKSFLDIELGDDCPIWARDPSWDPPVYEVRREIEEKKVKERDLRLEEMKKRMAEVKTVYPTDLITIVSQAFYGNRTITGIRSDEVDRFILGYMSPELKVKKPIDRTIVHIPGSDQIVLIYNRFKEEKTIEDGKRWLEEDGYVIKPLAEIPEMDLKIYSKCIACRMDADGKLESILPEDCKIVMPYLAK